MELLLYLLKVSACSALFFAVYLLSLKKLTFFNVNRFYLLASVLLSFVIPSLQFTVKQEVEQIALVEQGVILKDAPDGVSGTQAFPLIETQNQLDWKSLVPFLYGLIVAALLLLTLWKVARLLQHTGKSTERLNGLKLVAKHTGFTNCSFFNYVFIDKNSLSAEELGILLKHEEVHARQLHSMDKLLLMLAKAVLWFNPIIYLYDKELEQVHEYEADEATSNSIGAKHYAHLLLKLAVAKSTAPLIHNFAKSPVKARIKMLFNAKSSRAKKLLYLLALPAILTLLWGFTVDVVKVFPGIKEYTGLSLQLTDPAVAASSGNFEKTELSNKLENKPALQRKAIDTAKRKLPKLISSAAATVNTRLDITYIKKGVMEIFGSVLEAEDITWDAKNGIITAAKASLKIEDGSVVSSKEIVFDLNKGTYDAVAPSGNIRSKPVEATNLMKQLEYYATDSIKNNKKEGLVTLYGKALVKIDGYSFEGDKIEIDSKKNLIRAYQVVFSMPNQGATKAKEVLFDVKTKHGVVFGLEPKKQ